MKKFQLVNTRNPIAFIVNVKVTSLKSTGLMLSALAYSYALLHVGVIPFIRVLSLFFLCMHFLYSFHNYYYTWQQYIGNIHCGSFFLHHYEGYLPCVCSFILHFFVMFFKDILLYSSYSLVNNNIGSEGAKHLCQALTACISLEVIQ